jgi:uncharacterized membrane protein YcaP (DUF421 family)
MNAFWNFVGPLLGLGLEPKDLTFVQISLRGIIVFIATLAMVRIGHKRSLARKTAFDAVLIVILASVLSRAINGSAEDGNLIFGAMRRNHISRHDVEEDLRLAARTENLKDIRAGYVERSGDISFIEK